MNEHENSKEEKKTEKQEKGQKRDENSKRKRMKNAARRGLDVAGGTAASIAREKREQEKKERKKRQKDKKIRDKQKQLNHERKERDEVQDRLDSHNDKPEDSDYDLDNLTKNLRDKDNELIKLEKELGREVDERNKLNKDTFTERMRNRARTVKKVSRASFRGIKGAAVTVKFGFIIVAVLAVLFFGMMIASSVMMTYILPAGAFVVLTDEEGPDSESGSREGTEDGSSNEKGEGLEYIDSDDPFLDGATWALKKEKKIGSPFGPREYHPVTGEPGKMHNGIDVSAGGGTDIYAVQDGKVIRSDYAGGYGNLIVIQHDGGYQTYYAHMQRKGVASGTEVKAGDRIGPVGTTGGSTGNHLHFEIRKDNGSGEYVPIDPYPYVKHLGVTK